MQSQKRRKMSIATNRGFQFEQLEKRVVLAALYPGADVLAPFQPAANQATSVSNDEFYINGELWGMYSDDLPTSTGPAGTTNEFGSQAEKAWNEGTTGSNHVYIGVIDFGFQVEHPDLTANAWVNPFDPVDGIDNDGNGYIDDIHGWDFVNDDNQPYDSDGHGTHVAGTIGAKGGNSEGVAGVNWSVTMISANVLGSGAGLCAGAEALDYMTDLKERHGLNIVAVNNSWRNSEGDYRQCQQDAINRAADAGILYVVAAGNAGANNNVTPEYPANYSSLQQAGYDSVISVAAIDDNGQLLPTSNYGSNTVDLGAPGSEIMSSYLWLDYPGYNGIPYTALTGTSMAAPHVTGAAALYASKYPGASAADIRNAIFSSTQQTQSLINKTTTDGRLDVHAMLGVKPPGWDGAPAISISDASVVEGDSPSTTTASFTVSLDYVPTQDVVVSYVTSNGSATSGTWNDYLAKSGKLTFLAGGPTTQTIEVTVRGDNAVEPNETFFVNIVSAVNASVDDDQGTGTIVNDDRRPTIHIDRRSVGEGTPTFSFTVSLSEPATVPVSVTWVTTDGTARAGSDYIATSGTLTIPAGERSGSIDVSLIDDLIAESDETFFVTLSDAINGSIVDEQGIGTIGDNEFDALFVSGPAAVNMVAAGDIGNSDLLPVLQEAKSRWLASGNTTSAELDELDVKIAVADLPGRMLGMANGNVILIDRNAAGYGWFVDASPGTDFEFAPVLKSEQIDLLSVVGHELGHVLGYEHSEHVDGMRETLAPGERHLPAPDLALAAKFLNWNFTGVQLERNSETLASTNIDRTVFGSVADHWRSWSPETPIFLIASNSQVPQLLLALPANDTPKETMERTELLERDRVFENEEWLELHSFV